MPNLSIRYFLPSCPAKIEGHYFEKDAVHILMVPDQRYKPRCHKCGSKSNNIHSYKRRPIRDLNLGKTQVFLHLRTRKIKCHHCLYVAVEELYFATPYARVTNRMAVLIHALCKELTVSQVADHLGLDWKTVKEIDKKCLEKKYGETDYSNLRILAVDEIAIKKGHKYLTVVLDYETGRVVWMGEDRKAETLMAFFSGMTQDQREGIKAVAMDMWDPFIKATRTCLPNAKIVFDLFHVVSSFNKVIDKVRNEEYRKAKKEDQRVYRGTKYLLLKKASKLKEEEREQLEALLRLNKNLSQVMILRDMLKEIWNHTCRETAQKALNEWCALANSLDSPAVNAFGRMLKRHEYGILNHCDYQIHTSKLEGVNNKIKLIKRKAYGYHDNRYFILKVLQAFPGKIRPPD